MQAIENKINNYLWDLLSLPGDIFLLLPIRYEASEAT
jgi:hypothetical protein